LYYQYERQLPQSCVGIKLTDLDIDRWQIRNEESCTEHNDVREELQRPAQKRKIVVWLFVICHL
jgi:hypothetical protein